VRWEARSSFLGNLEVDIGFSCMGTNERAIRGKALAKKKNC